MPRPGKLQAELRSFVGEQFAQLSKIIADTVEESAALSGTLSMPDRSFVELQGTLELFSQFATSYYLTIEALASGKDYIRLARALQKIQHELFVLRRLLEQRTSAKLQPMLQVADRWCNTYLDRLIEENSARQDPSTFGSMKRAFVVTGEVQANGPPGALVLRNIYRNWGLVFFESEHMIRQGRFAYNRNPTIALPLVHAHQPWNWMGMAHEIGHFVFNNMEISLGPQGVSPEPTWVPLAQHIRQSIFQSLANKYLQSAATPHDQSCLGIANSIPLWCTWAEELFADLLGAVTLGPAYVESLILYIGPTLDDGETLINDDGDHPCNCLRPALQLLVHIKLLEAQGAVSQELKQELAEVADLWFRFCESHFDADEWPEDARKKADDLDLSTSQGIADRLAIWSTYVRRTVGSVPLKVLLEQISAVLAPYIKVLSALPLYDTAAHELTHRLTAAPQMLNKAGSIETAAQRSTLATQFVLYLPSQWYRRAPKYAGRLTAVEPEKLQRTAKHLSQVLGYEDQINNLSVQQAPIAGKNAVDTLIKPLLERSDDEDRERRQKILEAAGQKPFTPTQESRELADWLLGIQFATDSPYQALVTCHPGQTPTCS